jgi:hypothetical protein
MGWLPAIKVTFLRAPYSCHETFTPAQFIEMRSLLVCSMVGFLRSRLSERGVLFTTVGLAGLHELHESSGMMPRRETRLQARDDGGAASREN